MEVHEKITHDSKNIIQATTGLVTNTAEKCNHRQMILIYTDGGINRSFSGRLRLFVIFYYSANGNRSLARIIEVLMYLTRNLKYPSFEGPPNRGAQRCRTNWDSL
jgi:hypothetical protein